MNEKISYSNPVENLKKEDEPIHSFDLVINSELIGRAEISYYSKPLPYYQVDALYVEENFQSRGYAGKIMEQVEEFLKKRKKTGLIVDGILDGLPARGMYERRGWQRIPGESDLFAYNLPNDFEIEKLKNYYYRQMPVSERDEWLKNNDKKEPTK